VLIVAPKMTSSLASPFAVGNADTVSCTRREQSEWSSLRHGRSRVVRASVSGRVKPGDEQRLMIQAGSTEVTSVLRQRKYHNLPLFYLCAVLVLYPMTDSRRHTRERSLSGDFDSDIESPQEHHHDDAPAGKPGRKKNPKLHVVTRTELLSVNSVCANSNAFAISKHELRFSLVEKMRPSVRCETSSKIS